MVPVLVGGEWDSTMSVEGHQNQDNEDNQAFMNGLSADYWKTMGVPLVAGRDFDDRDAGKKIAVAIVNRKFATHFFGDKSPLGRHVGFGDGPKTKLDIEIVGVTEDSLYEGPREGVLRQVFLPFSQSTYPAGVAFYVRTSMDSKSMFTALRRKVQELDGGMPVYDMKTLASQLDETLSTERLIAVLSAAFGLLATVLAALGLYGVMAFMVARRTKEIGLRMALGAPQGQVVWMVMRETLVLVAAGLAIGIPAALTVSKYVSTQLFGFSCRYATNRMAFRFHKKTRLVSSSAPLARSCADLSTDLAAFPICREVRLAWSRTAARRCFPRAGSKKNIQPPPKPIPASPTIRPVLPCIESSPFQ